MRLTGLKDGVVHNSLSLAELFHLKGINAQQVHGFMDCSLVVDGDILVFVFAKT